MSLGTGIKKSFIADRHSPVNVAVEGNKCAPSARWCGLWQGNAVDSNLQALLDFTAQLVVRLSCVKNSRFM